MSSRTARADGRPLSAVLIVDNRTGGTITATNSDSRSCLTLIAGLANGRVSFAPGFATVTCQHRLHLPVGLSRFPVRVLTTYTSCRQPGGQGGDAPCVGAAQNQLPPLPPGDYHTVVVVVSGSAIPTPPPVAIVLTR